ncbi:hypothetical protein Lalb_Chr20g0110221 [Lupinus albus]|uniref:Uncharacterized protein n=1 Tax=Lupinus albus TaxID=3870 RepID=A0A6A4NMZ7_LUPAL|nr:hypothetical protein Lalb_Chr20g0110221 [Lupinus albus]
MNFIYSFIFLPHFHSSVTKQKPKGIKDSKKERKKYIRKACHGRLWRSVNWRAFMLRWVYHRKKKF